MKKTHLTLVTSKGTADDARDDDDPFGDPPGGPPKRWMYILRSYRRMAEQWHLCHRCCGYIEPGEMYDAVVIAYAKRPYRKKHLVVEKRHAEPCEEPPDPQDDEDYEDDDVDADVDVPMAA